MSVFATIGAETVAATGAEQTGIGATTPPAETHAVFQKGIRLVRLIEGGFGLEVGLVVVGLELLKVTHHGASPFRISYC
jgi:hypothetical protein